MPRVHMERSGEMEVFVRVVQEGGFSAAARSLDLTPSAVSKLISRLEARLATRLLIRTTRALTLTEEGEAYLRAAQQVLLSMSEAEQAASGGTVIGRLGINASIPFGAMYIAPMIPAFIARHPGVRIDLSFTDDVVDLLSARADIAIRMGTLPDSTLVARKLGQGRRVVCAAPAYLKRKGTPQSPADLEHHDCLGFNFRRAGPSWPFVKEGREICQPVSCSVLVNNGETLRQLALAGAGIARLGQFHVASDLKTGALVPVLEKFNPGDVELIHAVYIGGGQVPPRVRVFIDYMVKVLARTPLARS